jgi:Bacterial regulatory helix-turn-helix protein, lysR family
VEYRHIKFFIAVAEELSFMRAAARLRVAQPHLNREVRRLEDELDVRSSCATDGAWRSPQVAAHSSSKPAASSRIPRRPQIRPDARIVARRGGPVSASPARLPDAVRRFSQERREVGLVLTEFNSDE